MNLNLSELKLFLINARENHSYESGAREKTLPNGMKEIGPYNLKEFFYRDRYEATLFSFQGEEIIGRQDGILWTRIYQGGIDKKFVSGKDVEETYDFLREALKRFPRDFPERRGPKRFCQDEYIYSSMHLGSLSSFSGIEKILKKENTIYRLQYFGGIKQEGLPLMLNDHLAK